MPVGDSDNTPSVTMLDIRSASYDWEAFGLRLYHINMILTIIGGMMIASYTSISPYGFIVTAVASCLMMVSATLRKCSRDFMMGLILFLIFDVLGIVRGTIPAMFS